MTSERYRRGLKKIIEMEGRAGKDIIRQLQAVSPEFARYLVEFVFGDIYRRSGLTLKTKEMITLSSMVTMGNAPLQVKIHINTALNVGCTKRDIIEIILQTIPSAGFVTAMNALLIAKEVFAGRKGPLK